MVAGGYRKQEARELCAVCEETALATSVCYRCGRPLCDQHNHGEDERCRACEADFLERWPSTVPCEEVTGMSLYWRQQFIAAGMFLAIVLGLLGSVTWASFRMAEHDDHSGWIVVLAVVVTWSVLLVVLRAWRRRRAEESERYPFSQASRRKQRKYEKDRRRHRLEFLEECLAAHES